MGTIIFIFILIVIGVLIVSVYTHIQDKSFKREVVKPTLENFNKDFVYTELKGFDSKRIAETRLVMRGSDYSSSDYVKGVHEGLAFECANVYIADTTTDSNNISHTVEYFNGQWLIIKPNHLIDNELYIIDRKLSASNPNSIGFFKKANLQKVETESIGFNKEFKVFAHDPMTAFKILSPQKILELFENQAQDISVYLNNNELHIAIYSDKKMFKWTKVTEENRKQVEERIIDELLSLLYTSEILN